MERSDDQKAGCVPSPEIDASFPTFGLELQRAATEKLLHLLRFDVLARVCILPLRFWRRLIDYLLLLALLDFGRAIFALQPREEARHCECWSIQCVG